MARALTQDGQSLGAALVRGARCAVERDWIAAAAAFSPDGRRVVSGSDDNTVRIWNADRAEQPVELSGHDGIVTSVAFSPDGLRIVSGSDDKTVRIWNADGSGQPLVLHGHDSGVASVAFSPDGRRVISGSYDMTARVWSADGAGQPLLLRGHESGVASVAFSPDGRRVVSASDKNAVLIWVIDANQLRQALWEATPMCLSVEERQGFGELETEARQGLALCRTEVIRHKGVP